MALKLLIDSTAGLSEGWLVNHPEVIIVNIPVIAKRYNKVIKFNDLSPDEFERIDEEYSADGYRFFVGAPVIEDANYSNPCSVASIVGKLLEKGHAVVYLATSCGPVDTFHPAERCFEWMRQEIDISKRYLAVVDTQCIASGLASLVLWLYDIIDISDLEYTTPVVDFVSVRRQNISQIAVWTDPTHLVDFGQVDWLKNIFSRIERDLPIGLAVYREQRRQLVVINNPCTPVRELKNFTWLAGVYIRRHHVLSGRVVICCGRYNKESIAVINELRDALPPANFRSGSQWRLSPAVQVCYGTSMVNISFISNVVPDYREMPTEIRQIAKFHAKHCIKR